MKQRGRRSAAHLSIVQPDATNNQRPLSPLEPLQPQERKIFSLVASENPHLRQTDAVMLAAFAKCAVGLRNVDDAQDFQRLAHTLMSLSRQLRISPQARCDPKTLARRYADEYVGPKPWDRIRDEDDNDDEDK